MTFSPQPWDLLVWTEDNGRAGVADVRQTFSRRQILVLDPEDSSLEKVRTEGVGRRGNRTSHGPEPENRSLPRLEEPAPSEDDTEGINHLIDMMEDPSIERRTDSESRTMRENLILDITERERQILEFLGTTRWAPSPEDEGQSSSIRRLSPLPHPGTRQEGQGGNNDGRDESSRPSSPPTRYIDALHDFIRDRHLERMRSGNRSFQPRRRESVVMGQENLNTNSASQSSNTSSPTPHPGITLRWAVSAA